MSDPPISSARQTTASKSISSLSSTSSKSSISKKKPPGLDISRSIPVPTRVAPAIPGSGNKLIFSKPFTSEAERLHEEINKLQLSSGSSFSGSPASSAPTTPSNPTQSDSSSGSRKKSTGDGKKSSKRKEGEETVKNEDLEVLTDLGAGNGGTVTKVWNKKRGIVMARKLILVDAKPAVRKQILRELQIMNDCSSPYIVEYYGCFPVDVHVGIVMEVMDAGSLDRIYRNVGAIPIDIVGKVAEAVLKGLMYLYDVHRIIHRDIKPSNILANTSGQIKICDFGVSGELINSIANTFVGTSTYMSPERIQGAPYTIKSDVWSLGISLVELALGRFPFSDSPDSDTSPPSSPETLAYDPDPTLPLSTQRPKLKGKEKKNKGVSLGGGGMTMSILDLLQHIVNEPAPRLVSKRRSFPKIAEKFIEGCLDKDPASRQSPQDLLSSGWITESSVTTEDLKVWATSTIQ